MNAVNKDLELYTHIFIHDDASPEGGGIQSTTYWMSRYMGAKGFNVVVAGRLDRSVFEGTGVEVYPLKTPFRTTHTSDIRLFLLLLRLRVRYGRRVMLYSLLINNIKVVRWMGAFIPWPCISFVHGNETLRLLHRKPGTLRKNLRRCLCVFSNSRYTAGLVTRLGEMENLIVLPPGIPADRYRHDPGGPDTRYEKYRDRKTVLMLSRLVRRKGHSTVIRSIARLRSKHPDILLLIAGSGGYRSQIEQMIDVQNLQNQVELLGFIPEKGKPALYDACRVYCMPSEISEVKFDVEGFGITFLEAAARGRIVIGTDTGGIPDAIDDGRSGFLIKPGDDAGLADLLDQIFSEPEKYDHIRQTARMRAIEEFDWDKIIDRTIEIISRRLYG